MKALEWPQDYMSIFRIFPFWPKFETFKHVTCKNEENPVKNEGARVAAIFIPL